VRLNVNVVGITQDTYSRKRLLSCRGCCNTTFWRWPANKRVDRGGDISGTMGGRYLVLFLSFT